METPILERIRKGLLEKQVALTEWLRATPSDKKQVLLGPSSEQEVHSHLRAVHECIESAKSGTLGLCTVCHEYVETDLLEVDYTACVCIEHFSGAEVRHLESQLELAQRVQRTLLPQVIPSIPGMEIAAFSRPAQIVGGDYFDFVEFGNGHYGLTIADVAGHGVSASLHMASVQAMLHAIAAVSNSPVQAVSKVHELFVHSIRFTTFVTFFLGIFDPTTKMLTYCNAGHNPPIILHGEKNGRSPWTWLRPTGAAIGLVEAGQYREQAVRLDDGDLLVMYTDGVTEAVSSQDEQYGQDRLTAAIERARQGTAQDVVREIREDLEVFSEGRALADDTTLVVCRIT